MHKCNKSNTTACLAAQTRLFDHCCQPPELTINPLKVLSLTSLYAIKTNS